MKNALIVSCSETKINHVRSASNVYDGPIFRILRKRKPPVDLFVLSAKYGLIPAWFIIEPYDLRIENKTWNDVDLQQQWAKYNLKEYDRIYLLMGQDYVLPFADAILGVIEREDQMIRLAAGAKGIGEMQAELVKFCERMGQDEKPT